MHFDTLLLSSQDSLLSILNGNQSESSNPLSMDNCDVSVSVLDFNFFFPLRRGNLRGGAIMSHEQAGHQ